MSVAARRPTAAHRVRHRHRRPHPWPPTTGAGGRPGRTGKVYADWISQREQAWRDQIAFAALDPFRGYANALSTQLPAATRVLDAFHVVKVRHEALCVRMEVRDLHRLVVAAAGLKLRAA